MQQSSCKCMKLSWQLDTLHARSIEIASKYVRTTSGSVFSHLTAYSHHTCVWQQLYSAVSSHRFNRANQLFDPQMSLAQICVTWHELFKEDEKLMWLIDWLIDDDDWLIDDWFFFVLYMNCTSYFFNGFPKIVGTKPTVVAKTVVPPANDAYIQNFFV